MTRDTRKTLLQRLRDTDDFSSWEDFYRQYAPLIFSFARDRGCCADTAMEVLQETMVNLARAMPEFEYDQDKGKFRSYLLTVVSGHISGAFRRQARRSRLFDEHQDDGKGDLENTPDPGQAEWAERWDREWETHVFLQALERVRGRGQEDIFESFRLYILESRPVTEIMTTLGISENTIYQQRNQIIQMLKDEVDLIRQETGE